VRLEKLSVRLKLIEISVKRAQPIISRELVTERHSHSSQQAAKPKRSDYTTFEARPD
jgi:hypothetical protein